MILVVVTVLILLVATVVMVGAAYWLGLKFGWIAKAMDDK
jgi:hypothetical protein